MQDNCIIELLNLPDQNISVNRIEFSNGKYTIYINPNAKRLVVNTTVLFLS